MKIERAITITATILAVALAVAPNAAASPLLSGYGGPGAGNQAILGSTLLGGPSGGSSGGEGGSGGETGEARASGAVSAGSKILQSRGRGAGSTTKRPAGSSAGGSRRNSLQPASPTAETASAGSQPLGLSGRDVLYIFIALGALAMAGMLTRELTRRTR